MTVHRLKIWPVHYEAVERGGKKHKIRRTDDRTFAVGDILELCEWVPDGWDPHGGDWPGRELRRRVTHINDASNSSGTLPPGICVMSIEPVSP